MANHKMFIRVNLNVIDQFHTPSLNILLFLVVVLGMLLVLACNPFAGDGEEASAANSEELVEVNFDRPAESSPPDQASTEDSEAAPEENSPEPATEPAPAENPEVAEASAEPVLQETAGSSSMDAATEAVINQAWAFLSQCVSLGVDELEARQINGEWFVQSAGEDPDRYGIWKVDLATGSLEAHNIRAREWAPQINSECTQESFARFYAPTPAPPTGAGITTANGAITSLWATLVKCYPDIQTGNLQATQNPASAEWIVTGKSEVNTNYGVWAVRSNGEVVPRNRQAQGIHDQLGNGLC